MLGIIEVKNREKLENVTMVQVENGEKLYDVDIGKILVKWHDVT